jgi:hypothetical protein
MKRAIRNTSNTGTPIAIGGLFLGEFLPITIGMINKNILFTHEYIS